MSQLSEFSQQISAVLDKAHTDDFMPALADLFKALVPLNNVDIIAYPSRKLPHLEYNDVPRVPRSSTINSFLQAAFLLDPYYLAATRDKRWGFFCLSELAPSGFTDSEYYRIYYKSTKLNDECGYLIPLNDNHDSFINISLGYIDRDDTFSDEHLALLADIEPVIRSIINVYWKTNDHGNNQPNLRHKLESALTCFGSSMLTEREQQMVQLILHGYSTRAISDRLEISAETVKLHRKNAYAKLDINAQGELFHLFIDSLMSDKNYATGDPLVYYHQQPSSQ